MLHNLSCDRGGQVCKNDMIMYFMILQEILRKTTRNFCFQTDGNLTKLLTLQPCFLNAGLKRHFYTELLDFST